MSCSTLNYTFWSQLEILYQRLLVLWMTSKFVTPPVFLILTRYLWRVCLFQISSAITTFFFLVVINCLLFFNSFVCFEFAEKRAWSTTLVGCYRIYNTLKVVQMKRDAGCDWMKWCLLGNIYKCTFTRIQRSF